MFSPPVRTGLGINVRYLTYQLQQPPRCHCVTVSVAAPDKQSHLFPFITASVLKNFVLLKRSITRIQFNGPHCACKGKKNEPCFTIQSPKPPGGPQNPISFFNKRKFLFWQGRSGSPGGIAFFSIANRKQIFSSFICLPLIMFYYLAKNSWFHRISQTSTYPPYKA